VREERTERSAKIEAHRAGIERLNAQDRGRVAEKRAIGARRSSALEARDDGGRVECASIMEEDTLAKRERP